MTNCGQFWRLWSAADKCYVSQCRHLEAAVVQLQLYDNCTVPIWRLRWRSLLVCTALSLFSLYSTTNLTAQEMDRQTIYIYLLTAIVVVLTLLVMMLMLMLALPHQNDDDKPPAIISLKWTRSGQQNYWKTHCTKAIIATDCFWLPFVGCLFFSAIRLLVFYNW